MRQFSFVFVLLMSPIFSSALNAAADCDAYLDIKQFLSTKSEPELEALRQKLSKLPKPDRFQSLVGLGISQKTIDFANSLSKDDTPRHVLVVFGLLKSSHPIFFGKNLQNPDGDNSFFNKMIDAGVEEYDGKCS